MTHCEEVGWKWNCLTQEKFCETSRICDLKTIRGEDKWSIYDFKHLKINIWTDVKNILD